MAVVASTAHLGMLNEFNMNSEPVLPVKSDTELSDAEFNEDLDEVAIVPNNPVLIDISNQIGEEVAECDDQADHECQSCLCQVCAHKTTAEKRLRCFRCLKAYHENCRTDEDEVFSSDRWLCPQCKNLENKRSSLPSVVNPVPNELDLENIENVSIESNTAIPEDVASNEPNIPFDLSRVKKEKDDWSIQSKMAGEELDQSLMDVKNDIVARVARNFVRKMHHASRTKICDVVPKDHFGPVPDIKVGTCWRFRLQVSECGVHRPLVAGIHGRGCKGAYSIVLSGVYDDDQDFGDEFLYCGSGGRAKDPTKRYSAQIAHQKLESGNKALALNCNAPFSEDGNEAEDWRGGKPVRVIRNYRLRKHSTYAPVEGNRYDGIYKVVKYFPQVGKAGLIVWKFLMRRDDPEPAPWTEEGLKIISDAKLDQVIWPEDFEPEYRVPANGQSRKRRSVDYDDYDFSTKMRYVKSEFGGSPIPVAYGDRMTRSRANDFEGRFDLKPNLNAMNALGKRRGHSFGGFGPDGELASNPNLRIAKNSVQSVSHGYFTRAMAQYQENALAQVKPEPYEMPDDIQALVQEDKVNKRFWSYCKRYMRRGEENFRTHVKDSFKCRYCSELAKRPVRTTCKHTVCLDCITKQFSENNFSCPDCKTDLGSSFEIKENETLTKILELLFPDDDSKSSDA